MRIDVPFNFARLARCPVSDVFENGRAAESIAGGTNVIGFGKGVIEGDIGWEVGPFHVRERLRLFVRCIRDGG